MNGVCRVSHLVRDHGVNLRHQLFLSVGFVTHYLRGNINDLNDLTLPQRCFNNTFLYLDILVLGHIQILFTLFFIFILLALLFAFFKITLIQNLKNFTTQILRFHLVKLLERENLVNFCSLPLIPLIFIALKSLSKILTMDLSLSSIIVFWVVSFFSVVPVLVLRMIHSQGFFELNWLLE